MHDALLAIMIVPASEPSFFDLAYAFGAAILEVLLAIFRCWAIWVLIMSTIGIEAINNYEARHRRRIFSGHSIPGSRRFSRSKWQ